MRTITFIVLSCLLLGCSSSQKKTSPQRQYTRPKFKLNVKFEDYQLKPAGEWIGGTDITPKYYTAKGEEIFTPVFGVDIVPVTKRSLGNNGQVIYPHSGYQVVGDLKIEHYLAMIKKISQIKFDRSSYKPPIIVADSNFLEKGAIIKTSDGKVYGEYEFRLLNWYESK